MTYVMRPLLRKFALTAHITTSVGWIGAVVTYLARVVAAETSQDAQTVRASWIGMELVSWCVLIPLTVGSLLAGHVMALCTKWSLFRHYWVLFTLLLTVLATIVLFAHMQTVSYFVRVAAAADTASRVGLRGELLHAGGGLLVLLVIVGLNVYKPRDITPYGRRTLQEQRTESQS
ncbi:hypothetical protein ACFQL7_28085 [Halocatena marina]|uniref:DUF2269 domain-containing protein n=1 Tax=Halocatena marina TaxID=2934937 RepID=A0ABD5YVK7_9EURY